MRCVFLVFSTGETIPSWHEMEELWIGGGGPPGIRTPARLIYFTDGPRAGQRKKDLRICASP